jgi:iron complex transport system substrate-binding protein
MADLQRILPGIRSIARRTVRCAAIGACAASLSCGGGEMPDRDGAVAGDSPRDDLGRPVLLDHLPRRIVSLAPDATEILFAVGAGDRVVGVTRQCDYPPEVAELPIVGQFSQVNLERLLALHPDLVLVSSFEQRRFIKNLEDLEIPVYVCYPSDFAALFRTIRSIGRVTGEEERATAVADSLESELEALRADVARTLPEENRPRVYVEISSRPLMTAGRGSFIAELIRTAGGVNIGDEIERDYAVINPERIILRDPELILIFRSSTTPGNLVDRLGWERITAVRERRIVDDLDENLIFRAGPRSVLGARELYRRFRDAKGLDGEDLDEG